MIAVLDEQRMRNTEAEEVRHAIGVASEAQGRWTRRSVQERAKLIGGLRLLLAGCASELAAAAASVGNRPVAEKMVSEVLPLIEAARFLQKKSARILRTKRFGAAGRPLWLHGSTFEVRRKPYGVILIVGPANYPLFIPAAQMLHALAAGNAVAIKPAEGASAPLKLVLDLLRLSGIPTDLVQILPESEEAAREAVNCWIGKAIFTGSSENGRDFLAHLATQNTPSVMELSGTDAVFLRADADVALAAKAINFGLRLNAGNTCMAPHAIIVHKAVAAELIAALKESNLARESVFVVQDDTEALQVAAFDDHGLGAAIFSRDERAARAFADELATGFATINDIIVPTADPRFPFGGVRGSGFGVTRGAEGLLEMSYPQSVAVRRARFLPHLQEAQEGDAELFASYISLAHGGSLRARFQALRKLLQLGRERMRK